MIVKVIKYWIGLDDMVLALEVNGKRIYNEVWFGREGQIPKFFPEIYAALSAIYRLLKWHVVCGGGQHQLVFEFPVSDELMWFVKEFIRIAGVSVTVRRIKRSDVIEDYCLSGGWQSTFSGGKDSGLSYCLLDELVDEVSLSPLGRVGRLPTSAILPDVNVNWFLTQPYNTCHFSVVAAVHAIWNNNDKVVMGHEYCNQNKVFGDFFTSSNTFLTLLNKYMKKVCGVSVTSIISPLPGNRVEWLWYNRYREKYKYRRVFQGRAYDRMVHLYCGIPFPSTFTKDNMLPTYSVTGNKVMDCEVEHIFTAMKGHKLFGDNPLQNGRLLSWMEKYNVTARPVVEPKGLLSIFAEHMEKDTVDRWGVGLRK